MSLATPFIAKFSILANDGTVFSQPSFHGPLTAFILYDTSGSQPTPCSEWPMRSVGILRGAPGNGYASDGSGLFYGISAGVDTANRGKFAAVGFYAGPAQQAIQFNYSLVGGTPPPSGIGDTPPPSPSGMLHLDAPAPAGSGGSLSLYLLGSVFFGWCFTFNPRNPNSDAYDEGMNLSVNSAGALALGPDGLVSQSFLYSLFPSAELDFTWVDLSGEDYRLVTLAAGVKTHNPFTPVLKVSSLWSYADLSNTNFAGNTITNATFDNAVLNATNFNGAIIINATFNGATGVSPDFSGATLASVAFAGMQITSPVFDKQTVFNSELGLADFSNVSCPGAIFSGLDLQGVHFNNSNLTGAKFDGALLQGAIFDGATLGNADFSGAFLQGTQFTNTDVTQVTFSQPPQFSTDHTNRTSFAGSKIPGAGFNQSNWSYLDLSGAYFDSKPATITDLNAQWAVLGGMDLSHITFTATDPANVPTTFANAILTQTNFSSADLDSAVFSSANGEANFDPTISYTLAALFTAANLRDAKFDSAVLAGVDFSFALLTGSVTFNGATLLDTHFANAYLPGVKFTGLGGDQCGGLDFSGACLINASFGGTKLQEGAKGTPVLFDGTFLQGADFGGATLSAVNFGGAVLSTDSGSVKPVLSFGTQPFSLLNYQATTLDPSQTNEGTFCIDGGNGPCSAARLAPPNPMPTTWTQAAIVLAVDE